jgi:murein DD-endopeptidase MepM/ murein hydrolase activator NlpD
MKFDYSPAEPAPRRSARRSVVIASLCCTLLAAVVARETTATRSTGLSNTVPADVASLFSSETESAFDAALQGGVADTLAVPEPDPWQVVEVSRGQTLSTIFETQGMAPAEWMDLLSLGGDAAKLKQLRVGETLHLRKNAEQRLEELKYELDEQRTLHVRRGEEGRLEALIIEATMERRTTQAAGFIENSLFVDGRRAGLSNRLVMELAEIFGYDIDFALDLREGDRFAVVYDDVYRNGERLRDGDILAAEFVNQGRTYRAMRYEDPSGHVSYYAPDGQSLRKAFIRTPVDFARISSGFNLKRRHPILNTIRAHKGVDYAASTGTPVKAAGDGRVEFVGVKGGYGRVVILKHGSQYTTLYAHLSSYRKGLKVGNKIQQGQIIGYVGASGLATAPHLHYEFRINGVHKNPMTVSLPRANPLPQSVVAQWHAANQAVMAQLETMSTAQLAQASAARAAAAARTP